MVIRLSPLEDESPQRNETRRARPFCTTRAACSFINKALSALPGAVCGTAGQTAPPVWLAIAGAFRRHPTAGRRRAASRRLPEALSPLSAVLASLYSHSARQIRLGQQPRNGLLAAWGVAWGGSCAPRPGAAVSRGPPIPPGSRRFFCHSARFFPWRRGEVGVHFDPCKEGRPRAWEVVPPRQLALSGGFGKGAARGGCLRLGRDSREARRRHRLADRMQAQRSDRPDPRMRGKPRLVAGASNGEHQDK
jgi:hypothetical protein